MLTSSRMPLEMRLDMGWQGLNLPKQIRPGRSEEY
jgi:hypothetical protein